MKTTLIAVVAALGGMLAIGASTTPALSADEAPLPPNVIVIMVDDQVKGTQDAMPVLLSQIKAKGLTFNNGITPTALCCPSRASFLTGNQSHTTGVYHITNSAYGGWKAFHDKGAESDTLATRLDNQGYRTGLFGKYLNGFQKGSPAGYVPPGWDEFRAIQANTGADGTYYNYRLTGSSKNYGSTAADYSTDVTGEMAADFIANTPADEPFFVYYSPYGPHQPITPAPRDKGAWPKESVKSIAAFNEADVSDKPAWVRDNPLLAEGAQASNLRRQHTTVMSIDDQIQNLIDAAGDRISNTIVVYMSDNGFMLGSHRIKAKDVPYKLATEVPMYVRWDGHITPNTTTGRVTPQIDLTALIADGTGVGGWSMEGRNPLTTDREGVALEQVKRNGHPAYCGWRTKDYLYTKYSGSAGREFYDYVNDPDELENVAGRNSYATLVGEHRAQAVAHCSPTPPGFKW